MSDDIAIRVENLGKRYTIGRETRYRDSVLGRAAQLAASPFSWLISQLKGPSEEEVLWALKDVSFDVKRGEVLGIIGRNGAGKSTLLKILSRITEPTEGRAEIHGRVGSLLEVGTGMHPELTGRENIYLNGCILGMRKAEIDSKFDEIVEFSGIEKFIDTPVKRYSSGMRVRLGFAIAAHLEPEILIVDEVLAVGDVEFQKRCLGKMKDVAGHGRTVLFVSHNMMAVRSLCGMGLLLDEGTPIFRGAVTEAISRYSGRQNGGLSAMLGDTSADGCVRLDELAVVSAKSDGTLMIDQPAEVRISLSVLRCGDMREMNVNLHVNDESGALVFVTCSPVFEVMEAQFHLRCCIPADFMNDNDYGLTVVIVKNRMEPVLKAATGIVLSYSEPAREGGWLGKFPGIMRPSLQWDVRRGD